MVSSFAGEKVTEAQVSNAIDRAIEATGISPRAFQVAAEKLSGHAATFRYVVQVELDGDHTPDALRRFLAVVEQTLLATNTQYVLNRNIGALAPSSLHRMVRGHFDTVLRARTTKGRNDIQFKLLALNTELLVRDHATVLELILSDDDDA
ncbi:MAG: GH3 auxin-responsive promoter family protein [Kofleriaceae bacterium]